VVRWRRDRDRCVLDLVRHPAEIDRQTTAETIDERKGSAMSDIEAEHYPHPDPENPGAWVIGSIEQES
jgi:hypothetical protein